MYHRNVQKNREKIKSIDEEHDHWVKPRVAGRTPPTQKGIAERPKEASQYLDQNKLKSLNSAYNERVKTALTRSAIMAGGELRPTVRKLSTKLKSESKGPGVSLQDFQTRLSQVQNTSSNH